MAWGVSPKDSRDVRMCMRGYMGDGDVGCVGDWWQCGSVGVSFQD